jgi:hypothetical protein
VWMCVCVGGVEDQVGQADIVELDL